LEAAAASGAAGAVAAAAEQAARRSSIGAPIIFFKEMSSDLVSARCTVFLAARKSLHGARAARPRGFP
jgi:hypothetical protein